MRCFESRCSPAFLGVPNMFDVSSTRALPTLRRIVHPRRAVEHMDAIVAEDSKMDDNGPQSTARSRGAKPSKPVKRTTNSLKRPRTPDETVDTSAGFAPVVGPGAKVLILGSYPSVESFRQLQYYGNKHNAFWKIWGSVLGFEPSAPYEERTQAMTAAGYAIWDVLRTCHRPGSLDADIQNEVPNDLSGLLEEHASIDTIVLNGGTAARFFKKYQRQHATGRVVFEMPSTSPAHAAMPLDQKLARWRTVHDGNPLSPS